LRLSGQLEGDLGLHRLVQIDLDEVGVQQLPADGVILVLGEQHVELLLAIDLELDDGVYAQLALEHANDLIRSHRQHAGLETVAIGDGRNLTCGPQATCGPLTTSGTDNRRNLAQFHFSLLLTVVWDLTRTASSPSRCCEYVESPRPTA